jgi:hypothetical protein
MKEKGKKRAMRREKTMKDKVKRVLDLDEAIRRARILKDEKALTNLCVLMTLERIEDRLDLISFLLKQNIRNNALKFRDGKR